MKLEEEWIMEAFVSYTVDISYTPRNAEICIENSLSVLCGSETCFLIRKEENKSEVSYNFIQPVPHMKLQPEPAVSSESVLTGLYSCF